MLPPANRPVLLIAMIALLVMGGLVLCITKLPLPVRIAVAGTDLIAAAILFVAYRQQPRA